MFSQVSHGSSSGDSVDVERAVLVAPRVPCDVHERIAELYGHGCAAKLILQEALHANMCVLIFGRHHGFRPCSRRFEDVLHGYT